MPRRSMFVPLAVAAASVAGGAVLSGCGDTATVDTASVHPARVVRLKADARGGLVFWPMRPEARAGRVTVQLVNPASSGLRHGVAVTGPGVRRVGPVIGPGRTSTLHLRLPPGRYRLWCPVAGHAMAGERGTLTVR